MWYLQPDGLSTKQMTADQLSTTFAALADPTRRAILARLAQGEATVGQLAEPFLIARGRSAQLRPSRLQGDALKEAADWLAAYRGFWGESFDRLGEHLHDIQRGTK